MKTPIRVTVLAMALSSTALAEPQPGRAMPAVSVNDLSGTHHTERDLTGQWTIAFAMTDKDCGDAVGRWFQLVRPQVPAATRMLTFVAIDLFPLVPTSTVLSQAREATPRNAWSTVWFSRDGSFAEQLGLPESETPWVFVIDPTGRVVESIHASASAAGVARVAAALNRP